MKKIIFTVTNDLITDQRMQRICSSLQSAGFDVTLCGRKLPDSGALNEMTFRQHRLPCFFKKGKLFYAEYNLRLFWYLLRTKTDAIGAVDLDTLVACSLAARIKNIPISLDCHEYFTEVPEVQNRKLVKKIWLWVERTFLPKADLVYTVSGSIATLLTETYGKEVKVIRNLPKFSYRKPVQSNPKVLLYQGALNMGRKLEDLIDAGPQLPVEVMIAGTGDLDEQLHRRAQELPDAHIHFTGRKSPQELKAITRNAYLGYNLLENMGKSYYYSLANKFFDYMQAGIPQLCSDFPEYRAINQKYHVALLLPQGNPGEIIHAVNRLLNDQELYQQLSNNCERAAKELCWENEEKLLIGYYEQLFR